MKVKPLNPKLVKYLKNHNLTNKIKRQLAIFERDYRQPSLHTEILEPRWRKIYSFRIDRKYRAIFVITGGVVEIIDKNPHYQ